MFAALPPMRNSILTEFFVAVAILGLYLGSECLLRLRQARDNHP